MLPRSIKNILIAIILSIPVIFIAIGPEVIGDFVKEKLQLFFGDNCPSYFLILLFIAIPFVFFLTSIFLEKIIPQHSRKYTACRNISDHTGLS